MADNSDVALIGVQVDTELDFRLATRLRCQMHRAGGAMAEPTRK